MCDPVQAAEDIVLTATGNPEFIPLANAATGTVEHLARGDSLGKSLGQGALTGVESLAGQELAGAVGIGQGNSAFNDAAGITWDNPAGTGLPDIGGGINDALGSFGKSLGFTSGGTAAPVAGQIDATGQAVNSSGEVLSGTNPVSSSVTPSSGGGFTQASNAADFSSAQINTQISGDVSGISTTSSPGLATINANTGAASDAALGAAGGDAIGSTTNVIGQTPAPANLPSSASPAASDSATSSWKDMIPSKAAFGKAALSSAIPAATLGYEAIKGPPPLPSATQPLGPNGAVTAPLLAAEKSQMAAFESGNLTAPQQAIIDQWVQQQQNALLQQLANSGVTNPAQDSRYVNGIAEIQKQALAQKQAMLQQDIQNAFSAAGAAGTNLANVANAQAQNDAAYQEALAAAMAALGGVSVPTQKAA